MKLDQLISLRTNLILEGSDINEVNSLILEREYQYSKSIIEDVSAAGGPGGAAAAASIGVGGGGVGYANAAIGGMGAVVSAQPSTNVGVTTEPGYSSGGGKVGSGDISVPYNPGGRKKVFQKIPAPDNRKGSSKRRKNKVLANLKSIFANKQDFTAGQGESKPKRVMNFDSFSKDELNKVTKLKQ